MSDGVESQHLRRLMARNSQWQPMELAPKDGTVIVAHDGKHRSITDWCDRQGAWLNYADRPWHPIQWRPRVSALDEPSEGE